MQFDGVITGKVFPKGPDGNPDESAVPLAVYAIKYNGLATTALQAVVNDMMNRCVDLVAQQVII